MYVDVAIFEGVFCRFVVVSTSMSSLAPSRCTAIAVAPVVSVDAIVAFVPLVVFVVVSVLVAGVAVLASRIVAAVAVVVLRLEFVAVAVDGVHGAFLVELTLLSMSSLLRLSRLLLLMMPKLMSTLLLWSWLLMLLSFPNLYRLYC